ncbi:MAG: hypothetical protein HKN07_15340 [Acidimicrobiia bacterium]|nr:hypothetical protein [Acidimicrobiia bacterium]
MHPARWTVVGGFVTCAISLALGFVTLPLTGTISGLSGDGWPILLILAIPLALAVLGDRTEGLGPIASTAAIALCGVAVVFAVAKFVDARLAVDAAGSSGAASIGPGIWLMLTGAVIALMGSVASTSRRLG